MNYCNGETKIYYDEKSITNATETKFFGLVIDDTLFWKQHTEQVVNKLSSACYVLSNIRYIVSLETLRLFYFDHVHSIMSYGIIFCGDSSHVHKVFILQKKIIRIITNTRPRDSCRQVFRKMEIMMVYSQYIVYIHYFYLQLIIDICSTLIMSYKNIKLEFPVIYICLQ
jgi:hypothetical protein